MDEDDIWLIYFDIKQHYLLLFECDKEFIDTFLQHPLHTAEQIDRLWLIWKTYCN